MKSPAVHKTSQKGKQRAGMLRRSSIQGQSPPLILAASGRVTREPSFKGWKDETRECIWLATENAQISQNQRTAKKRPDIRNNSHWGIGSDKVWQDAPGKVQLREKETPRSPGRRPESLPVADRPETQLSNFPWFGLFVLIWCFVHAGVVTMFLFFSSFFREDLPCWFNDWVHFLFRHRWRFFDSKKKGASAWQNSPINRKAKYCSEAGSPAYWTNLNWTDVLTSTFLSVEGFWIPLISAIVLHTHEILQ